MNAIFNNFDFYHFWPNFFEVPYFFLGGGQKVQKLFPTDFLAFSGNFEQLFFFIFDKKSLYALQIYLFFGGGG